MILSTRAERLVVRDLAAQGWLDVLPTRGRGKGRYLRLTAMGIAARGRGAALVRAALQRWRARFDAADVSRLERLLAQVVEGVAVQLPAHFTSYGPGDGSVTGGSFVPADPGPPPIPAHGAEWPVVLRAPGNAAGLSVPSLLSQALTAFAIDYQAAGFSGLGEAMQFLRHVPDAGMELPRARKLGAVTGTTRSTPERHLTAVAEPGTARTPGRRVFLSPKGRRFRDAFPAVLLNTEDAWSGKYGPGLMADLYSTLETMEQDFIEDAPDYSDGTRWFRELHARNP